MLPITRQFVTNKYTSEVIEPIEEGIEPLIELLNKDREVKLLKLPICDGRVPVSPGLFNTIDITLA
jgi:hypothetical protein